MPITLMQAAQAHSGNVRRQGFIETFPATSQLLSMLPFINVPGGAYVYSKEAKLPNIGFRGLNEAYGKQDLGILNPETEVLKIGGGIIDIDHAMVKQHGDETRDQQEYMKTKAMALTIASKIINGDSTLAGHHNEFDGLRSRITGNQRFAATGNPGTNGALSLEVLDAAIDAVPGANAILLDAALRRKLSKAAKKGVGGDIQFDKDDFGRPLYFYNGIPMIPLGNDAEDKAIIGFNEAGPAGDADCTSIYVVNFNDGKVVGLQNGDMDVNDEGIVYDNQNRRVYRTYIEWQVAMGVMDGRAASRVWGIKHADVVE